MIPKVKPINCEFELAEKFCSGTLMANFLFESKSNKMTHIIIDKDLEISKGKVGEILTADTIDLTDPFTSKLFFTNSNDSILLR